MATRTHGRPTPIGLEAVQRSRLYEGVAAQIRKLIWEGHLQPGARLPPERELMERLQVSRSSVRDAIRLLELLGLVRCRQGEGTTVRDVSADTLSIPLSSALLRKHGMVEELIEARKMIEPAIAAHAALRASPEHLQHLREIVARQREKLRTGESGRTDRAEFHYALATAAGNDVVNKVLDLLLELLNEPLGCAPEIARRWERSYAGHRRILRAVERRDPDAAERAMRNHLQEIQRLLRRSV